MIAPEGSPARDCPLALALAIGLMCGAFAVWRVFPYEIVLTGVINPSGDLAQALSGAIAYTRDEWRFPLFDVEGLSGLGRQNIVFTDSIPGLSLIYKLFGVDTVGLQRTFWSVFMVSSVLLQGVAAALACHILGIRNPVAIFGAALLLVCWPPFLYRVTLIEHLALTAHWILLIAVALLLAPPKQGKVDFRAWFACALLGLLIHPYFFVFVAICFLGRMLADSVSGDSPVSSARLFGAVFSFVALSAVAMIAFGHIGPSDNVPKHYSGFYSANLAAPIMPGESSLFVPAWGVFPRGQVDGFAYFGIGAIGLLLLAGVVLLNGSPQENGACRMDRCRLAALIFISLSVAVYSLGDQLYFSDTYLAEIPVPGFVQEIGSNFRAHGRFLWIVSYTVFFAALVVVTKRFAERGAFAVLLAAIVAQIEITPLIKGVAPAEGTISGDTLIEEIVAASTFVEVYPPYGCDGSVGRPHHELQLVAVRQGKGLANSFVSGRANPAACELSPISRLVDGLGPGETAFVLAEETKRLNLLYSKDWTKEQCRVRGALAICRQEWKGIPNADGLAPLRVEEFVPPVMLLFKRGERGADWLISGFSRPERWGSWSVGTRSVIHVPLAVTTGLQRAVLAVGGFLPSERESGYLADIGLSVGRADGTKNRIAAEQVRFSRGKNEKHRIEFDLGGAASASDYLEIVIEVSEPLSPLSLGISNDARQLGISVSSLQVE